MIRFATALALVLIAAPVSAKPKVHHVEMAGMKFMPAKLTVKAGDTVVWKNTDLVPHTVQGDGFTSTLMQPGDTFKWTAEKAGPHAYLCSIHPMMKGSVVVQGGK